MTGFDRSKERRFGSRDRGPRSFGDRGDSRRSRGGDRELTMTKVICSACGKECEVPFKPTSSKPVFCSDCFRKKDNVSSTPSGSSNADLAVINEKLDKIMRALDID